MDNLLRRRNMRENESAISVAITGWSYFDGAQTRYASSNTIDATNHDAYITIPFVEGATQFKEGVTQNSQPYRIMGICYSDAERTELVGYYWDNIMHESYTTTSVPYCNFETEYKIAPKGYYVRPCLFNNSNVFSSNANSKGYAGAYVKEVILK